MTTRGGAVTDSAWTEHGVLHYLSTTGTPMHHATWWATVTRGRAPEPINPGDRLPLWDASDVVHWQQQRLNARPALVDAIDWQELQDDRHGRQAAIDRAEVAHELWRTGQGGESRLPHCTRCDHPNAVHHPGGCMANDGRSTRPCACPPLTIIRLPRPATQETPSEAASGPTQRHLRVVPPLPPKYLQAARDALRAAITAGRAYLDDGHGDAPPSGAALIGWWPPRNNARIWLYPAAAIEAIQHELPRTYTRRKLTNDLETAGLLTREAGHLPRRATPDGRRHRVWDVPITWLQPAIGPRRHD